MLFSGEGLLLVLQNSIQGTLTIIAPGWSDRSLSEPWNVMEQGESSCLK